MGNQNQKQGNIDLYDEQYNDDRRSIVDLDRIVEEWTWQRWIRTRSKASSHYKRDDLLLTIDWTNVAFTQDPVQLFNSSTDQCPRAQTLFRTTFENQTNNEQTYTVRTERTSSCLFKYILTDTLSETADSSIVFRLPDSIVQTAGGIPREQSFSFGRDFSKEYDLHWHVNSQLRVPSRTRTNVELLIDEEEFRSDFSIPIRFSGRVTVSIAARHAPQTCLKLMTDDIMSVVRDTMKNTDLCNGLNIRAGRSPSVCFTLFGKCSFRYGVKQNISIHEELLIPSLTCSSDRQYIPSAPTDYCHLPSFSLNQNGWHLDNGKHQAHF